jgi:phosphoglycolate phosphatase
MIRNLTGKNSTYNSVFFDLDGTVTDSGEGCLNGVRHMFKSIGYMNYDEKELKRFIGPAIKKHLIAEYGFSEPKAEEAYAFFKDYYLDTGIYENKLYDGITDAIESITQSGKSVYIATSKPLEQAIRVLEHFGIRDMFSDVFGARHELGIYDKSKVLESAVKKLGGVPGRAMVGDRSYDIIGGRHVGFDTVGVLYGYGEKKELLDAGCDFTADSTADLAVLLGRGS